MRKYDDLENDEFTQGIGAIFGGIFMTGFMIYIFLNAADNVTQIAITPFIIAGVSLSIIGIVNILKVKNANRAIKDENILAEDVVKTNSKLESVEKLIRKMFLLMFFVFIFGFLLVFDYIALRDNETIMILISGIFWIAAISSAIKSFRNQ